MVGALWRPLSRVAMGTALSARVAYSAEGGGWLLGGAALAGVRYHAGAGAAWRRSLAWPADLVQIFALAVRLALESSPGSVVCKLDFKNAFNTCSRRAFLRYTARHFPALLLFLLAAYVRCAAVQAPRKRAQ